MATPTRKLWELCHALRPGAIALAVFVKPSSAPVVRMGLQNIGAQVLTDDALRRIGGCGWGADERTPGQRCR